jgi:hypothetical protein
VFCQGLHAFSRVETPWGISVLDQAGFWRYRPREGRLDGFYGGNNSPQNPWGWVYTKWAQPIMGAGNVGAMWFPTPEMIRGWQGGRRDPVWASGRGRKTTALEIIESAHFPAEWQGVLLPTGYINNSVWTIEIERDRSGLKLVDSTKLPPLIQSKHGSFRPIDLKLGPDGALYLADWYNPIIGHYQVSFRHPDRDKSHGRIWRITAKGRPLLRPPPLAKAALPELFELLRAADVWPREQAKRMLFGRDTATVTAATAALVPESGYEGGGRGLRAAAGARACSRRTSPSKCRCCAALWRRPGPNCGRTPSRRWPAGRIACRRISACTRRSGRLAQDADDRVRLAAVVAAGNIPQMESLRIVMTVAAQPRDPFIDTALRAAVAVLKPHWEPETRARGPWLGPRNGATVSGNWIVPARRRRPGPWPGRRRIRSCRYWAGCARHRLSRAAWRRRCSRAAMPCGEPRCFAGPNSPVWRATRSATKGARLDRASIRSAARSRWRR